MKDSEIIQLYNERNERAIYETHQKYGDYCMSISLDILQNHQDAEECVNDTYLNTWKSIPPKQPSVLRTYLGKLVRNLSIDRLRTRRRARRDSELTVSFEELEEILTTTEEIKENAKAKDAVLGDNNTIGQDLFWKEYGKDRQAFIDQHYYEHLFRVIIP